MMSALTATAEIGRYPDDKPLGHRDDVRLYANGLVPPHIAGAAKARDHLVADQQYAIFAADRLDLRPVIGGRNDDAACALHRFADKGSDIFRADFEDFGLDCLGTGSAEIASGVMSRPSLYW